MLGSSSIISPFSGLVTRLRDWPVASQQRARRNAMLASTACAQRRAEREDVADFLVARYRPAAEAQHHARNHARNHAGNHAGNHAQGHPQAHAAHA